MVWPSCVAIFSKKQQEPTIHWSWIKSAYVTKAAASPWQRWTTEMYHRHASSSSGLGGRKGNGDFRRGSKRENCSSSTNVENWMNACWINYMIWKLDAMLLHINNLSSSIHQSPRVVQIPFNDDKACRQLWVYVSYISLSDCKMLMCVHLLFSMSPTQYGFEVSALALTRQRQ